jgi:hypothetical protein
MSKPEHDGEAVLRVFALFDASLTNAVPCGGGW